MHRPSTLERARPELDRLSGTSPSRQDTSPRVSRETERAALELPASQAREGRCPRPLQWHFCEDARSMGSGGLLVRIT